MKVSYLTTTFLSISSLVMPEEKFMKKAEELKIQTYQLSEPTDEIPWWHFSNQEEPRLIFSDSAELPAAAGSKIPILQVPIKFMLQKYAPSNNGVYTIVLTCEPQPQVSVKTYIGVLEYPLITKGFKYDSLMKLRYPSHITITDNPVAGGANSHLSAKRYLNATSFSFRFDPSEPDIKIPKIYKSAIAKVSTEEKGVYHIDTNNKLLLAFDLVIGIKNTTSLYELLKEKPGIKITLSDDEFVFGQSFIRLQRVSFVSFKFNLGSEGYCLVFFGDLNFEIKGRSHPELLAKQPTHAEDISRGGTKRKFDGKSDSSPDNIDESSSTDRRPESPHRNHKRRKTNSDPQVE